jgi:hypothetical protein
MKCQTLKSGVPLFALTMSGRMSLGRDSVNTGIPLHGVNDWQFEQRRTLEINQSSIGKLPAIAF